MMMLQTSQSVEFPVIWINDLRFVQCRKVKFFIQDIYFADPRRMPPGPFAPLATPSPFPYMPLLTAGVYHHTYFWSTVLPI
jgi:hypothetical protein